MLPSLHPEILDHIVEYLHDELLMLEECCLVSKSWVPRTRSHLFDFVAFDSPELLELWMKTFPDPSNSPACYTRSLRLFRFEIITVAISDACPWVRSFNRIVELEVSSYGEKDRCISFTHYMDYPPPSDLSGFATTSPAPGGHQPCLFLSPSRRSVVVFSRTSRMGKRCPRMWSFDCAFRESSGSTRHSGPSNPNTFSRSLSIYSPSSSAQPTKQLGWRDRTLAICWYQPLHHAHNVVSRPHAALCS